AEMLVTVFESYADRPALGERAYEVVADAATGRQVRMLLPRFDTITYAEVHQRVRSLAAAWRHDETHRVAPGEFVCMVGFTGSALLPVDAAYMFGHPVSVPLQSSVGRAALDGIFGDTEPAAVVATLADVLLVAELVGKHPSVRSIIVADGDER